MLRFMCNYDFTCLLFFPYTTEPNCKGKRVGYSFYLLCGSQLWDCTLRYFRGTSIAKRITCLYLQRFSSWLKTHKSMNPNTHMWWMNHSVIDLFFGHAFSDSSSNTHLQLTADHWRTFQTNTVPIWHRAPATRRPPVDYENIFILR